MLMLSGLCHRREASGGDRAQRSQQRDHSPASEELLQTQMPKPSSTGFPGGSVVKNPPANAGSVLSQEDPLEDGMTSHSSILAWRIPTDRGAWWATVRGVTRVTKRLSTQHMMFRWDCGEALVVKNPPPNAEDIKRCRFDLWVGKIPWRRVWQPILVFLPGKPHGQKSQAG